MPSGSGWCVVETCASFLSMLSQGIDVSLVVQASLQEFMQLGRHTWTEARAILTAQLAAALTGSGTSHDAVSAATHLLVRIMNVLTAPQQLDVGVIIEHLFVHSFTLGLNLRFCKIPIHRCRERGWQFPGYSFVVSHLIDWVWLLWVGRSHHAPPSGDRRLHGLLCLKRACHERGLYVPGPQNCFEPQLVRSAPLLEAKEAYLEYQRGCVLASQFLMGRV